MWRIFTLLVLVHVCGGQTDFLLLYQSHLFQINAAILNGGLTANCSEQLLEYYDALQKQETWALMMFDAKSKVPSGLAIGNFFDLGSYDECLGISNGEIRGKYCLGMMSTDLSGSVNVASCLPTKCTAEDFANVHTEQTFDQKSCFSKETEPELSGGAITAIVILSIFGLLAVLSTSYDVYLYYKRYKPGTDLAIAFSYFTNGRKLLSSSKNPDQLLCLNGMKAITMMWILMGHEYMHSTSGPVTNYLALLGMRQTAANMFILGATVSVDTFLAIGGLVTVYTFMKATEKRVRFNIILYYIHRYIRLTPALAIVVMLHATLLNYFGNGPLWSRFDETLVQSCQEYWWSALLYIQNYVNNTEICVPQSWYLSIDMQLFLLSPLVLHPLKTHPKWTLIGLGFLTIASIVIPFGVAFGKELNAYAMTGAGDASIYLSLYYYQTYGRFGPYVMGMILGYIIYRLKKYNVKIEMKWFQVTFLWTVCLAGGLACVYASHESMLEDYDRWSHSLFIAFNRPAFALAICGIIFLCVSGYGGPIDAFLSASVFQFISKLSYALYLVHYSVILLRVSSYKTGFMIEHFYMFFNYWGDFVFSMALSVVLCLTFESPMIAIEKLLLGGASRTKTRQQKLEV